MPSSSLDVLASLSRVVPARLAELASGWSETSVAAEPRTAASVVLCRDGAAGLETYLLHRHARMRFAASMVVFPGGGVDPADLDAEDPLLACAVRETQEETGVELDASALLPWAHWITPAPQPIRYDTHFFVAAMPAGQSARDASTETERAAWTAPAAAMAAFRAGSVALMPPTVSILTELAGLSSVAELLGVAGDRTVETVRPAVVRDSTGDSETGWVYRYPAPAGGSRPMIEVAPLIGTVLAPNPGPMTLDGTNTWILGSGSGSSIVVDPGPADPTHLRAVHDAAGTVAVTVLTHRHHDHSEGLADFAALTGAGVRAADSAYAIVTDDCDGTLANGQRLDLGGLTVTVLATPGHTSDSTSLLVEGTRGAWLLTGDMVLGRGTTVITHPDGDLGAYLDSLELMLTAVREREVQAILPGHGPVVSDPVGLLTFYQQHRLQRLEQVREALRLGDETPGEVVARVYADVDRSVWPAAEQSVRAQLDYLHSTS